MALDDFLRALEECPDDELHSRFNLGENYIIYFRANFEEVTRDLDASDEWEYSEDATKAMESLVELGNYRLYDSVPIGVTLQAFSWLAPWPRVDEDHIEEAGYNMSFMMVNDILYRDTPSDETHHLRRFANGVRDLLLYAREKGIPVCLPKTKPPGSDSGFVSFPA